MIQQLKARTVLIEDLVSVASTHMVVHSSVFQEIQLLLLVSMSFLYTERFKHNLEYIDTHKSLKIIHTHTNLWKAFQIQMGRC